MSIKEKYDEFVRNNGHEPAFCCCYVRFNDSYNIESETIKMSSDVSDDDELIFFYCDGLNDLLSLTKEGYEDFLVLAETVTFTDSI